MTPEEQAVIDAARAWRNGLAGLFAAADTGSTGLGRLAAAIDDLDRSKDELVWEARTLADVRAGDTVRLPTAPDLPARVLFAMPLDWHVRSGGDGPKAHWNDVPLEHRMINVRLDFKGGPRDSEGQPILREMPADVPIEIQLSAEELRAIDLMGWDSRVRSERADG